MIPVCHTFEQFQAKIKDHSAPTTLSLWSTKDAKNLLHIAASIAHRDGLVLEELAGEILKELPKG